LILSLEAALAATIVLSAAGLATQGIENPFYKNAAFALADDSAQAELDGFHAPPEVGGYCISETPCNANCVKATRTQFNGEAFEDEELIVCWNE